MQIRCRHCQTEVDPEVADPKQCGVTRLEFPAPCPFGHDIKNSSKRFEFMSAAKINARRFFAETCSPTVPEYGWQERFAEWGFRMFGYAFIVWLILRAINITESQYP